jgi:hypothetical protein
LCDGVPLLPAAYKTSLWRRVVSGVIAPLDVMALGEFWGAELRTAGAHW